MQAADEQVAVGGGVSVADGLRRSCWARNDTLPKIVTMGVMVCHLDLI